MPSKREQVLDALLAVLRTVVGPEVRRGGDLPTRIPAGGLIVLRDGDPGEPDVTLSPVIYEYRHRADIEVILQPAPDVDGANSLDATLVALGEALEANPTLGGACMWCEPQAPATSDLALEGVAGIVAAIVPVELNYITTGPLA